VELQAVRSAIRTSLGSAARRVGVEDGAFGGRGGVVLAAWAGISFYRRTHRRVRASLTRTGSKSKGACLRTSALSGLQHGNQLSPSVSPVCCALWTTRPLFYDLTGLHSLEQARAGDDAESNAPARAGRKLIVSIFFTHRSKIGGFQLHDDHGQSLFVLRAYGR